MKGVPEELLYVLIFAAVVLFQYLIKRFGPQPEPEVPPLQQDEPDAQFQEQARAAPEAAAVPAPDDIQFGRARPPGAAAALPRRRFSRGSLMGTKRELQRAVVIATILGPCRAFEPHDIR